MNKLADSPAFPFTPTDKSGQIGPPEAGMTLRQFAAIHAMQGLMSNFQLMELIVKSGLPTNSTTLAKTAITNADALLAELAKTTSQSC